MDNLLVDENFKFLDDTLSASTQPQSTQIVAMMTRFRKNLCFSWISKIVTTNKSEICQCIARIIRTILQFTIHSDATVRVTAYSTLGAILVTITPFAASLFPKSFKYAIDGVEVTPKLSIAVINMFMYLTRFVSPVFLENFITEVPVSFHFSVDVSEFIQYIPMSIPLMKKIPLELLQNILRSLICSCGRKPNAAFTSTIASLVRLNLTPQLNVLLNYIKANNLDAAAVWLAPELFVDRSIYDQITSEDRTMFLNYALKEFNRSPLNLCQFELACKTCALFLRYSKDDINEYNRIHQLVKDALSHKEYSPVYKVRMLFLPTPIDQLNDNQKDNDSLRGARLTALATHFEDNIETCDADHIAEMFTSYQSSDNDLYCTFVDSFARCIPGMLSKCKSQKHIEILEFILKKKNKNWVHDVAVANLIDQIPVSLCNNAFPAYTDLALDRLLEFELSSNDKLVEASLKSLKNFSSYENIENMLMRIMKSNWHTEPDVERRFMLLSELALLFPKNKLFLYFIPFAYECMLMYENVSTLCNIYAFLSRVEFDEKAKVVPHEVVTFTISFIIKRYELYTRKELDKIGNYSVPIPDQYFLDTLDTDIVTNPTINHQDALIHMKNAYAFLLAHQPKNPEDLKALFTISMHLVPIFDSFALQGAAQLVGDNTEYDEMMWILAQETFKSTSRDEVAACCCQYFVKHNQKLPPVIRKSVLDYLDEESTLNPELLFLCFVLTDLNDHEQAIEKLPNLIKRLPPKEATLLLFKLTNVVGRLNTEQFPDEYAIALLEYVNYGEEYSERVRKYINTVPFSEWPLEDGEMIRCLLAFLGPTAHIKVPLFERYKNKKPQIQNQMGAPQTTDDLIDFGSPSTNNNNNQTDNLIDFEPHNESNDSNNNQTDNLIDIDQGTSNSNPNPNNNNNDSTSFDNEEEELDKIHWKFVIHHINLFDKEGVINFISSHLDTFAKIDISEIYQLPDKYRRKPFEFDLLKFKEQKLCKLATLSQFIDKELVVDTSLPLLHSYFSFTYNKISYPLLLTYLNIFVKANDDEGVSILLDYAIRNSMTFNEELQERKLLFDDDVFFTDKTFVLTLRHLARIYMSISKIDQKIIERIELKIGYKITPDLIFSNDPPIQYVVMLEPQFFLNAILAKEVYKAHDFIPLFQYLLKIPFDPLKIISLVTRYAPQYMTFTSIRKKIVFLRFVLCSMFCLRNQGKIEELKVIVDLIDGMFTQMISLPYSSFFRELSLIFVYLVNYSNNTKLYTNSFFSTLKITNVIYPLFVRHMAFLSIKKKEPQPSLTMRHIKKFNIFILPSERNCIFNTFQLYLTNAGTVEFFALVKPYINSLQPELYNISKNFLTGQSFLMFIMRIMTNPQAADLVPIEFYRDLTVVYLGNVRRAVFNLALPLSVNLTFKQPELFNHLLHSIVGSPGLINSLEKIYGELRVRQSSRKQQELLDVQIFEEYLKLFSKYITISSGKLLYQIGKNTADLPSYFFNNLIMSTKSNFLFIYCILKEVFVSLDSKTKQEVITVVSASGSLYTPKSRELALNSIISDENRNDNVNFLIAASETDDVDSLRNEYADILNTCSKQ
ncbi:hypothetical protein M9Y10_022107 [Tritrichomonas musculus]|uniref:Uncharacterized protein n=1 Tax=Tritrichomonas musculus TaxID=1915356 RepID=A0ABR2KRC6_9EUKA